MEVGILDILNFVFLGLIPILIKFLNDLKNLYVEIEKHKVELRNLREDLKELRVCLSELKKMLISKNQ